MSRALHSPWQANVPRIAGNHQHWLTDNGSLTQKLKRHSSAFGVIRLNQSRAPLQQSETIAIALPRARRVLQRQVLLLCNGVPAVFAHTVTPLETASHDWPFFNRLGNRALGIALFSTPLIFRQKFEYTRLSQADALYQAAINGLKKNGFKIDLPTHLWARRCVFSHARRPNSRMMVTEVMLPTVYKLKPSHSKDS